MNQQRKKELQELYPEGCRVELIEMKNDPYPVPNGTKGTVTSIDDMCQVQVNWDNGSTLALIDGLDEFKRSE